MKRIKTFMQTKKLKLVIMICALMFGLWITKGDVSAATIRQSNSATQATPILYVDYISRTDGRYNMEIQIDLSEIKRSYVSQAKGYRVTIKDSNKIELMNKAFAYDYNTFSTNPTITIPVSLPVDPQMNLSVLFELYTDEACTTPVSGITFSPGSFTVPAVYNISTDEVAPTSVTFGQEMRGPVNLKESYVYYTFTLNEAATISGPVTNIKFYEVLDEDGDRVKSDTDATSVNWKLPAGIYTVKIGPSGSAGSEYSLNLACKAANWGSLSINWNISNLWSTPGESVTVPFTVTLTGAESGIGLFDAPGTSPSISNGDTKLTGTAYGRVGNNTLTVVLLSDDFGRKEYYYNFKVNLAFSYNFTKYDLSVGTKTASVKCYELNYPGLKTYIEIYKGKKWVLFNPSGTTNSSVTVTGLKANTQYKVRMYQYYNGMKSSYSNTVSFYTGHSAKPSIKSIKISNVKVKTTPKVWHSGFYSGGTWFPGYYTGGQTITTYKVTLTLKKNPPKGTSTYVVVNDKFFKAKGKKYVGTLSYVGKPGKKTMYVRFARSSAYNGSAGSAKKKVTIKK